MLKVDPSLNHIPARREHVVALYESINQPLVNIPGAGTAPTYAFILGTRNDQGLFTVFVYLFQQQTGVVVVYVCEPRGLTREQFRSEEAEAVRFVESMGFLVDNVHFPTLPPHEQDAVMQRSPLFRPPPGPSSAGLAGGAPSMEGDALFGGLGEAESEVFRRAGVTSGLPPGVPADIVPGTPAPAEAAEAEAPEPASPEAKARIGRLLGMFGLLGMLAAGPACLTPQGAGGEDARSVESHVDLGNQQLARGLWPDAVRTFSMVLEKDEAHRDALYGMGIAYYSLERMTEAEGYLRKAVEADPKWSMPKNQLAVVLIERNACDEAKGLLEQVKKDIFYPTPEYAEHNYARALACNGDRGGAIAELDKLLLKRPQFCLGYLTLAEISFDAKQHETTIRACDDFVDRCENDARIGAQILPEYSAKCYLKKGLAYAEMGDVESARAAFERCTSRGPNGRECRRSLELLPP